MTIDPQPSYLIRAIQSSDRDGLTRFYAALSPDSLEARFHGAAPGIGDRTARSFCGPDHEHREGIVAEATAPNGRPTIVGHVCLEPISPYEVEMAIAISDAWQHHGLGRAMLTQAIAWAGAHGITRLRASMRCSNGAIVGLIRSMGYPVTFGAMDGGVVDAAIDIRDLVPSAA